jgi:hypothetical protein
MSAIGSAITKKAECFAYAMVTTIMMGVGYLFMFCRS